jgi:alkyl hydroperoxide reductase subunit AhpC
MSVLDEKREELEHYEFRMGVARGRLAVALDSLTDALTMVGQHGVYCPSARQPGRPAMDIQIVMKGITDAKELIASVMEELRKQNEGKSS